MEKKIKVLATLFAIALSVLTIGCTNNKLDAKDISSEKSLTKPVNIIVIVDTSDRVSKARNPRQIQKDIKIIESIVNIFEEKFVRVNLYIGSRDRLALAIPEQPNVHPIQQQTLENLKIWLTPKQRAGGAPEFKKMKTKFLAVIGQLYQSIGKQIEFTGSDIWKWFRESAEVYLKSDTRNYIICLSDGYLDFNNDIQNGRSKVGNKTKCRTLKFSRYAKLNRNFTLKVTVYWKPEKTSAIIM